MTSRDDVIAQIRQAFAATPSPGPFLVNSREGSEPDEIRHAFAAFSRWTEPDATTLDRHYDALSFLSEGGFRFFLPAFLIADLQGRLQTADPIFHLTHGFSDRPVRLSLGQETLRPFGGAALLNPRRYGAITFRDHARFRLSVFPREEAQAIVAYLQFRLVTDPDGLDRDEITAALDAFWLDRAAHAPDQAALDAHVAREAQELQAMQGRRGQPSDPQGQ